MAVKEFPGRGKVAVIKTSPETVLEDYQRLMHIAGYEEALPKDKETILKINISWHKFFPACSTTPWQLEGVIKTLLANGYARESLVAVQNRTPVVSAKVGEIANKQKPVVEKYGIRNVHIYEPQYKWVLYQPKEPFLALHKVYPKGLYIPEFLIGRNIIHLPTVKCIAPSSEVVLADGRLVKISDLIEGELTRGGIPIFDEDGDMRIAAKTPLFSLADDGSVISQDTCYFWRTPIKGRKLWLVRTKTDKEIKVSAEHPFLTANGWRRAADLKVGDRIAIPRRIKVKGKRQPLPSPEQTLKLTSPDFWRWMGYFIAEGCVQLMPTTYRFWWTNSNPLIQNDFVKLTRDLFDLSITHRLHSGRDGVYYFDSIQMKEFFEEMGLPVPLNAGNKVVPPLLYKCSDEEIAAFLQGYFDGDATIEFAVV